MAKKKEEASVKDVLGLFWQYIKRRKWQATAIVFFVGIAVAADSLMPLALKRMFDAIGEDFTGDPIRAAFGGLALLLLFRFIAWLAWRLSAVLNIRFQPNTMVDIYTESYEHLIGHSYKFFANNFAGSLVKKLSRLTRAFEHFADEITYRWLPIFVVMASALIGLYSTAPIFAYIFIVWFIALFMFSIWAANWAVKADVERNEQDSKLGGLMADTVSNAVTVKTFGTEKREWKAFSKETRKYASMQTRSWGRHEFIRAAQSGFGISIEIGMLYIALNLWEAGELSVGDFIFIQSYLGIVFVQVWQMSRSLRTLFDVYSLGKEMVEVLKEEHGVQDAEHAKKLKVTEGEIVFNKVHFGFGKNAVLKNFSVNIAPDEKIALVGPSGAGKTTITKLLFRFFDVKKGAILIDGQEIAGVTQESLHRAISMVPQEPILFHRTLRENIKYGKPGASEKEMIAAAKKAHAHEFIMKLPKKYNTYVGERGVKLSGGERQRVAIARAILEDAPILVLDEATSALDSESEVLIQDALKELMKNKTVIAIAHRLSTISSMDRILVIADGKIADQGSHEELLQKDGIYKKLWGLQAGEFLEE